MLAQDPARMAERLSTRVPGPTPERRPMRAPAQAEAAAGTAVAAVEAVTAARTPERLRRIATGFCPRHRVRRPRTAGRSRTSMRHPEERATQPRATAQGTSPWGGKAGFKT